jgi:hypothetical protein
MAPLLVVGSLVLLLVLLVYAGLPVLIHQTLKQPAQPQVLPFPLDHPGLPKEVACQFQTVIDQLRPAGFEPVTGLALPNALSTVKRIVLVLVNRPAKDSAYAMVTYGGTAAAAETAASAPPPIRSFCVEIVSRFRLGPVLHTANGTSDISVFAPRPRHTINRFPQVEDAGRLYVLHQALVARSGLRDKAFRLDEEFHGDAAAAAAAFMVEELEDQVGTGYMYLSPEEKIYRPTWKGAFLMTWKLLWPVKGMRRAARERKARQLLAELEGLGGQANLHPTAR